MGKKTPLGKHSSYEDKVSHFLSKMIDKEVTFRKTDSQAIIKIKKPEYEHHISLPLYWEFAKNQSPDYVAQYIVTEKLPNHLIDYYHEQYVKEWPVLHEYKKAACNIQSNVTYDYDTSGNILANGITVGKLSSGAIAYADSGTSGAIAWQKIYLESKSAHATKQPLTASITITPDLEQFHKSMQNLGKAMSKAAEEISKNFKPILEQFEKVLAETEKQAALYGAQKMPAKSVLSHPGFKKLVDCPACSNNILQKYKINTERTLNETIIHLNDSHRWKREQIADWLDTLDEQPIFYPDINFEAEGAESA